MRTNIVIDCRDVHHTYPNGVEALRGITLQIRRGEYVAMVGQNGSGKTTLAKHFNGLLKPTDGSILVLENNTLDVKVSALSKGIGYVFQNPDDMLFCSSVEEEIAFGPKLLHFEESEIQTRVETIMKDLALESVREAHPFSLSLGDRQRLAVACVLALDPEVFVFDEPTTGQDYFGGESIMKLIDQLNANGKTVIIISHDMNMVAEHAKRIIVMNKGLAVLDGTPKEVFSKVEQLESLSLRPPQVTILAKRLGQYDRTIITVNEMCDFLKTDYLHVGGGAR